jgi:hypothetical protein
MKELKNKLLLDLSIEDVPNELKKYFEITLAFQKLFISNLKNVGARTNQIEKAKFSWVTDIRLMIEQDDVTIDELKEVWSFLKGHKFWSKNILSTDKLRKQFDKLHAQLKTEQNGQQTNNNKQGGISIDYLRNIDNDLRT